MRPISLAGAPRLAQEAAPTAGDAAPPLRGCTVFHRSSDPLLRVTLTLSTQAKMDRVKERLAPHTCTTRPTNAWARRKASGVALAAAAGPCPPSPSVAPPPLDPNDFPDLLRLGAGRGIGSDGPNTPTGGSCADLCWQPTDEGLAALVARLPEAPPDNLQLLLQEASGDVEVAAEAYRRSLKAEVKAEDDGGGAPTSDTPAPEADCWTAVVRAKRKRPPPPLPVPRPTSRKSRTDDGAAQSEAQAAFLASRSRVRELQESGQALRQLAIDARVRAASACWLAVPPMLAALALPVFVLRLQPTVTHRPCPRCLNLLPRPAAQEPRARGGSAGASGCRGTHCCSCGGTARVSRGVPTQQSGPGDGNV
jgi:hypothetical protein